MTKDQLLPIFGVAIFLIALYLLEKIPIFRLLVVILEGLFDELLKFLTMFIKGDGWSLKSMNFVGFLLIFFLGIVFCLFYLANEEIGFLIKLISDIVGFDIIELPKSPIDFLVFGSIFLMSLMLMLLICMKIVAFHENNIKNIQES